MRIELPFAYEVQIQLPRNRRAVPRVLVRYIEADIPEIADQDAPVAARWFERGSVTSAGVTSDVRTLMTVRHHDGRFYRPLVYDYLEAKPATSIETVTNYIADGVAQDLYYVFCRDLRTQTISMAMRLVMGGHTKVMDNGERLEKRAEVVSSKLDEALGNLEAALSEYIIIDGGIWRQVSEPVFILDLVRHTAGIVTTPVEYGTACQANRHRISAGGVSETKTFRFDQFEVMDQEIREWETAGGRFRTAEVAVDGVEVLLPEAFSFDPTLNEIHRQMQECWRLAVPAVKNDEGLSPLHAAARQHSAAFRETGDANHLTYAVQSVIELYAVIGRRATKQQKTTLASLVELEENLPISVKGMDQLSPWPGLPRMG